MAIVLSNGFLTDLKTTTQTTNLQFSDLVGEINISSNVNSESSGSEENGGGSGGAGWYFYSDEGNLNAGPPLSDGNIIFTITTDSPIVETFNPNSSSGTEYINIAGNDAVGTSYLTQFNNLQSYGGTISITQNGDTATYYSANPGPFFVESNAGNPFLVILTATQTVSSSAPFVFGDPITIEFGCYTYTFGGTDIGEVIYLDCSGVEQTARYDGPSTSGYDQTTFCAKEIVTRVSGNEPTITGIC